MVNLHKAIKAGRRSRVRRRVVLSLCLVTAGLAPAALSAPGDLVIPRKEGEMSVDSMPASVFPHWIHRIHYRCDACHDSLFEMKYGGTPVTMDLMGQGKVCGTCHNGQLAFPSNFDSCHRCHVEPEE